MNKLIYIILLCVCVACKKEKHEEKITTIDSLVSKINSDSKLKEMSINGITECDGTIGKIHKDYYSEKPIMLKKISDIDLGDSIINTASYFHNNKLIYIDVIFKNKILQKVYIDNDTILSKLNNSYDDKKLIKTANHFLNSFNNYYN